MKSLFALGFLAAFGLGFVVNEVTTSPKKDKEEKSLKMGAFSVSLNVNDLQKSKTFYETLGFRQSGGDIKQNYVIMKNGNALIGLFSGFFKETMLTFNPGWDENKKELKKFDDVRSIQKQLKLNNIPLLVEASDTTTGPAYILFNDPDGNVILVDQHR